MTFRNGLLEKALGLLVVAVALAMIFGFAGCNTMRGLGQDIEKAGEAIQKSSN